ncbi:MAG: hypothetical protein JW841_13700 [Deltaproteobacteria bacterium]|nr:hypothetical protein [Deltaproteobacteria bacterium]
MHQWRNLCLAVAILLAMFTSISIAYAHWCDCLWASRYNVVVRPESDSVDLSNGANKLVLYVQNNMGYPLIKFSLEAYSEVADISIARATPVLNADAQGYHYLLPGENLRHELTLTPKAGTSVANLAVEEIKFYIFFDHPRDGDDINGSGTNDQGHSYSYDHYDDEPNTNNPPGTGVVIQKTNNTLAPTTLNFNTDRTNSQARHVNSSSKVDFGNDTQWPVAIDQLFDEYCAGRGSWSSEGGASCSTSGISCCGKNGTDYGADDSECDFDGVSNTSADNYDWQHLWAAGELAYRKDILTENQILALRKRLQCGWYDAHLAFKTYAAFALAYIDDDGSATDADTQSFFTAKASDSKESAAARKIAQAALYLITNGGFYASEVNAGLNDGEAYVEMMCAAVLSYVNGAAADPNVINELINRVYWGPYGPDSNLTTAHGMLAAHLLNLLAWEQRGYQRLASYTGKVSFYNEDSSSSTTVTTQPPIDTDGDSGSTNGDSKGGGCNSFDIALNNMWLFAFILLIPWKLRRYRHS